MPSLYTCSYRAYRPGYGQPVVTSLQLPRWLPEARDWPVCHLLTPRWSYFKAADDDFEREYRAQLDRFGPAKIARTIQMIAREREAQSLVLICYEATADQCHRGLFARWLLEKTGEVAAELP